jgi:hypothetical protein
MGADASIYSQIRPYTMADPLDTAAKAYSLQAAGLQIKDAQRKFQLEDDLSGALADANGDLGKASQMLAQRGRGTAALQLSDKAAAQRKAKVEEHLKLFEAIGSDAIALDQSWRQLVQKHGGNEQAALADIKPVYDSVRARWVKLGHELPEQFDPQQNFAGIGMAKENIQYLKTLAPNIHMTDTGGAITPTNTNPLAGPVGPLAGTQPIPKTAAPAAPTELARLTAERDALEADDPKRAEYDRVIKDYKAGHAQSVTVNTGPMTPGKTGANKVDEDLLGVTRNLMQLDQIAGQFKPEFQRFQDKAAFSMLSVKDSTVGLTNKEKTDLTEYSQYRRNAFNTLNEYIKSITGAAMTNAEATRILKGLPNPGSGLFDGDSPTEFRSKLDDAVQKTKMSVARLAYIKRHGMSLEDGQGNAVVPLERMPALINERGRAIEAELKAAQPDATPEALKRAVRRQLGVEFGLSSD